MIHLLDMIWFAAGMLVPFLLVVHGFSAPTSTTPRVLVLGSTGFLGKQIVSHLDKLGIDHITASRSGADFRIDLTADDAEQSIQEIAKGCFAVISTVGSIGHEDDLQINAATGHAAIGAAKAGVERFVFIGNEQRVRDFAKSTEALRDYAEGKEKAESVIREHFPNSHTIIQPNFIYGGEDFSLSPPRVPAKLGKVAEDILGLYPFQAASESLPGMLGVAVGAPVSRERVAAAAVNAALGLCRESELGSRNKIVLAASRRFKTHHTPIEKDARALKMELYDLGNCVSDDEKLHEALGILEEIEAVNERHPASDDGLNGRWEFCFDVEAELRSALVKDVLEGHSPIKPVFNVQDICLKIFEHDGEQKVNVYVSTKILSALSIDLIVKTTITADDSDPTGTIFLERFEGIKLAGIPLPIPEEWRKGRPLELSYLDDTMLIARGNGGEPHYLRREADDCDVDLENCYL